MNPLLHYRWSDVLRLAGLALVYALLGKLVLGVFSANGVVSTVWPPSGLALAMLLIGGRKYWPAIFAGELANSFITAGNPAWVSVSIASGCTLEALAGVWLLARIGRFGSNFHSSLHSSFDSSLTHSRDFLWLGFAGALSTSVSALIGVTTLWLTGFLEQPAIAVNLLHWWQGNVLGIILVTPLILVWRRLPQGWLMHERVVETVACFGLAFLFGQIAFLDWFHDSIGRVMQDHWMFLFVVWGALRFGRHGALLIIVMTAVQALLGAVHGVGFFATDLNQTSLFYFWWYMLLLTLIGMTLALSINERKLTADILKGSENRVHTIMENVLDGIITINEQGIIESFNKSAERIFGYNASEVIGNNVSMLMPEPYRSGHDGYLRNYTISGVKKIIGIGREVEGERKNGSSFPMDLAVAEMWLGKQRMFVGSMRDITERKQAEHALKLSATVYQAIGEAVLVANADNQIIAVNPAFTQLTGYTEQEVVGQSPSLLKSGFHDKDFYWDMWHTLEVTGHWQGEIWNRRKDGEACREWLAISTIYDEHGAVQQRIGMYSDITDQKLAEQAIWQQANFDPLTGLPNRRMFHDRLEHEMKRAHRAGRPLALMFLDLDRFKEVNDALGHEMGDALLKEAAQRLHSCIRETDTVARLGGDEFTVILGELDDSGSVERIAQHILGKLATPFKLGEAVAYVSVSIGISLYPEDTPEIETLIKHADQAMYAAKHQGRNRYNYFDSRHAAGSTDMDVVDR